MVQPHRGDPCNQCGGNPYRAEGFLDAATQGFALGFFRSNLRSDWLELLGRFSWGSGG